MFNDLFVVKIAFVAAVFAWLFTISDAVTQTQPNSFAQICKAELPEYSKECSCFITFKLRNPSSRCMDNSSWTTATFDQVRPGSYCIKVKSKCCICYQCESVGFAKSLKIFKVARRSARIIFAEDDKSGDFKDWPFNYTIQTSPHAALLSIMGSHGGRYNFTYYVATLMQAANGEGSHQDCTDEFGRLYDRKYSESYDNFTWINFTNVTAGSYCFRVVPHHPSCDDGCVMRYTKIFTVEDPEDSPSTPQHRKTIPASIVGHDVAYVVIAVVIILGLIMICVSALVYRRCRTVTRTGLSICRADSSSSATQILTLSEHHQECDVSVFIVFTEDCERHVEVVTALVGLLRSFGCDVHYALELRCKACIQLDPFNWFRRQVHQDKIDGKNHKIIWIASEMACLRFDGNLSTTKPSVCGIMEDDVNSFYEVCTRMLLERINDAVDENPHSYIAIAILPYHQEEAIALKGVLSDTRYELPKMLGQLYEFLHDEGTSAPDYLETNLTTTSSNRHVQEFVSAIKNMMDFKCQNPNAIRDAWLRKVIL